MARGVSTILAIILLIILIITFFGLFYSLNVQLDQYQNVVANRADATLERVKEDIVVSAVYLSEAGNFIFQLFNKGGYTARIVALWVNDTVYDLTDENVYIAPGQWYLYESDIYLVGNQTYIFKFVTERGNIIVDYWPKLVHIGAGAAEIPGGVGAAQIVGTWAAGKLKRVDVAEIKNIGTVPFKINVLCRIVFLSVDNGTVYSGYLRQVNDTSISPTAPADWESEWIYPGETAILSFTMYEDPLSGYYYDVYLHLFGYDAYGNLYSQAIYLGRYYLEQP